MWTGGYPGSVKRTKGWRKLCFSWNESEKFDFIEAEIYEFTDSDNDENERLLFHNKDGEETTLAKQTRKMKIWKKDKI